MRRKGEWGEERGERGARGRLGACPRLDSSERGGQAAESVEVGVYGDYDTSFAREYLNAGGGWGPRADYGVGSRSW